MSGYHIEADTEFGMKGYGWQTLGTGWEDDQKERAEDK